MTILRAAANTSGIDASAWVSLVAAAIAVIAVVVATWQARSAKSQADSARRQADAAVHQTELQERIHRDSNQPYVWADFRLDLTQGSLLHLVVRNEGPTVAEDVRIVFDPPLQGSGVSRSLDSLHVQLAGGRRSMAPGREMKWAFAVGHRLFDESSEVPHQYWVTITGRGPHGDLPPLTYPLGLDELREVAAPRFGSLEDIAQAIKKLAEQTGTAS